MPWYQNGRNNDGPFDTSFTIGAGPDRSNATSASASASMPASSSASSASSASASSTRSRLSSSSSTSPSSSASAVPDSQASRTTPRPRRRRYLARRSPARPSLSSSSSPARSRDPALSPASLRLSQLCIEDSVPLLTIPTFVGPASRRPPRIALSPGDNPAPHLRWTPRTVPPPPFLHRHSLFLPSTT